MFFQKGLDGANQLEIVSENSTNAHGPENFRPSPQNDFFTTICQERTHAPLIAALVTSSAD
jgi:hypothetical protein